MGYPRSVLLDAEAGGTYHCVSRCVRRAFLCGADRLTGRNFDHRKQWIEDRLMALANIFSVSVFAYAVMSNHVHLVLNVDPRALSAWSDRLVATRWLQLFPVSTQGQPDTEATQRRIEALLGNADRLAVLRQRLGSLSWFMRCLSEPLARLANQEDGCTGRFWEGRFKCQALLDEAAVLACMTYVDLNPVRAGIASDLPTSHHTSIQRRLRAAPSATQRPLEEVAGLTRTCPFSINLAEYIELVDWTGRQLHPGKAGIISASAPPALRRVQPETVWLSQTSGIERRYCRAIGSALALLEKAQDIGQRWLVVRRVLRTA
jgi:REP element-mobilizing transposase RayT